MGSLQKEEERRPGNPGAWGEQGAPMLSTALLFNSKREGEGRKEEKRRREGRKEGGKEGRKGGDGRRKSRAMKLLMRELLVSLRVKF